MLVVGQLSYVGDPDEVPQGIIVKAEKVDAVSPRIRNARGGFVAEG